MKRKWIPVAITGALMLGYLAGKGRSSGSPATYEFHPPAPPAPAPPPVDPAPIPPPVSPTPMPQPPPVEPPAYVPPSPPPRPEPSRRLGEYPAWYGVDLNCKDIGHPVQVTGPDPHQLDRDGDGIGCESS